MMTHTRAAVAIVLGLLCCATASAAAPSGSDPWKELWGAERHVYDGMVAFGANADTVGPVVVGVFRHDEFVTAGVAILSYRRFSLPINPPVCDVVEVTAQWSGPGMASEARFVLYADPGGSVAILEPIETDVVSTQDDGGLPVQSPATADPTDCLAYFRPGETCLDGFNDCIGCATDDYELAMDACGSKFGSTVVGAGAGAVGGAVAFGTIGATAGAALGAIPVVTAPATAPVGAALGGGAGIIGGAVFGGIWQGRRGFKDHGLCVRGALKDYRDKATGCETHFGVCADYPYGEVQPYRWHMDPNWRRH